MGSEYTYYDDTKEPLLLHERVGGCLLVAVRMGCFFAGIIAIALFFACVGFI